jgi:hypothetical protein
LSNCQNLSAAYGEIGIETIGVIGLEMHIVEITFNKGSGRSMLWVNLGEPFRHLAVYDATYVI